MKRREFLASAAALAAGGVITEGCATGRGDAAKIELGVCAWSDEMAKLVGRAGFDYYEQDVATALDPDKDDEWWKRRREEIWKNPLPLKRCNGFLPGTFRLTGPAADHAPALRYAEKALRRAEEVGVESVVFGSSGARNVPGDIFAKDVKDRPDLEKGVVQYTDFCRELCRRTADLRKVAIVIEPLRPNESNIINFVWQGIQICDEVASPRLRQLADIFHMMMGRESAESIIRAGALLRHCHVASYGTRLFPGSDPATIGRLVPYFDALRTIGYRGGVSCECGWGAKEDNRRNLETALATLKRLVAG